MAPNQRKPGKAGIDLDDARRKREENIIELRKNAKDDSLAKRRQAFASPADFAAEDSTRGGSSGQRVSADRHAKLVSSPYYPI